MNRENILVGRRKEQQILLEALESSESEMVSVIGRRRVGKTFLISEVYKEHISFEISGIQHAPREEQLMNFVIRLAQFSSEPLITKPPKNWLAAFVLLIDHLKKIESSQKQVVFFDELPWMATHKSGFLRALSFFWNSWANKQNIVVVICGSAASWMINKVVRHKGGLHNRITKRIHLHPFNLKETKAFLEQRQVYYDHYQIITLYMAMGGIPHYLKEVKGKRSAVQNIDEICFSETGLLKEEFSNLYLALFDNATHHIAIVRALATTQRGMSRSEIIGATKLPNGGKITNVLEELDHSGFIKAYHPFGKKKKDKLFRLTDAYSLFYLRFIENNRQEGKSIWQLLSQTQAWKTWSGYAFENVCLQHLPQIKKALGIAGVYAVSSSFYKKGTAATAGTQIDLLIDRNDHVINLVEIKFYNTSFTLSKSYAQNLRDKMRVFREATKTKKHISIVLITTFGMQHNSYSLGLVDNDLDMELLFE